MKNDTTFYSYLKNILNFKIDDDKSAENLNNIVSLFLDKFDVSFYDNCKNYTELFSLKISELSLVTYMSYWLKNEYFNLEL